jgi:predicted unusual protein kinase regulating ubiquinone biosynthesis (AarF/ABC1/UbiB family)
MLRKRYLTILFFFARVLLGIAFWDIFLTHIGLPGIAKKGRIKRYVKAAHNYRLLAIRMGGVLIKVGQFLSVRVDMLPVEVTDELSGLQDQVPPEDFQKIRALAEKELGKSLDESYTDFEEEPLASASLGQVHRAKLQTEKNPDNSDLSKEEVVIKIQRPGIDKIIDVDLKAFRVVSGWLQRYKPIRKRADLPALMEEFSSILGQEIDYLNEGKNAEKFWEMYKDNPAIKTPQVYWEKTTRRVLTLEDVYHIKITNYEEILAAGVELEDVAQRLFSTYMQQIFEEELFHADPHPGNLFIIPADRSETGKWQLAFVDFGMVGSVPESAIDGLREAVIAIGTQDASRLVKSYQMLDFLLPQADLELIEQAESKIFERVWGKSMIELRDIDHREFMEIGYEFRDLMYDMPFQIPQHLLLLGRAVAILSGMCTGLDPSFNVWKNLRPYAEELIKAELTGNWDVWWEEIEMILRSLISMPRRLDEVLGQLEMGEIKLQVPDLNKQMKSVQSSMGRLSAAVVFFALFSGSIQLILAGFILPGYVLLGVSLIPLLLVILR